MILADGLENSGAKLIVSWVVGIFGESPGPRGGSGVISRGLILPGHFSLSCIGKGNGNPLQCSCLENPKDRGAWWAAVYGVTQSQTCGHC